MSLRSWRAFLFVCAQGSTFSSYSLHSSIPSTTTFFFQLRLLRGKKRKQRENKCDNDIKLHRHSQFFTVVLDLPKGAMKSSVSYCIKLPACNSHFPWQSVSLWARGEKLTHTRRMIGKWTLCLSLCVIIIVWLCKMNQSVETGNKTQSETWLIFILIYPVFPVFNLFLPPGLELTVTFELNVLLYVEHFSLIKKSLQSGTSTHVITATIKKQPQYKSWNSLPSTKWEGSAGL